MVIESKVPAFGNILHSLSGTIYPQQISKIWFNSVLSARIIHFCWDFHKGELECGNKKCRENKESNFSQGRLWSCWMHELSVELSRATLAFSILIGAKIRKCRHSGFQPHMQKDSIDNVIWSVWRATSQRLQLNVKIRALRTKCQSTDNKMTGRRFSCNIFAFLIALLSFFKCSYCNGSPEELKSLKINLCVMRCKDNHMRDVRQKQRKSKDRRL